MRTLRKMLKPLRIKLRKRRHARFLSLIDEVARPINILDVGGDQRFWESMDFVGRDDVDITLLNPQRVSRESPGPPAGPPGGGGNKTPEQV